MHSTVRMGAGDAWWGLLGSVMVNMPCWLKCPHGKEAANCLHHKHRCMFTGASISKSRLETSDHPKRNGQRVQGMSAAPSDTQQQVQAGTDFNAAAETRGDCGSAVADMVTFSGTATELRHIVYVLAALEEGAFHSSSGSSAAWYPSDGRIQLQRCRRRGELVYRLRVSFLFMNKPI